MTSKKQTKVESDEKNISITDVIHLHDDLKNDFDLERPDDELTPGQKAMKDIYLTFDKTVEDALGKEVKSGLDETRRQLDLIAKLRTNFTELQYLGREIEKNFIYQNAYLINHFNQGPGNAYKVLVNKITAWVISPEINASNEERIEQARKLIEIINSYRNKIVSELVGKQEILAALIPNFEKKLSETNWELYHKEIEKDQIGQGAEEKFKDWLKLSKELFENRKKAMDALEISLYLDELLPKQLISDNGDITINVSSTEMRVKGERMVKLINEANRTERSIEANRPMISEKLFGKVEQYLEIPQNNNQQEAVQQNRPEQINPLRKKSWFRFAKVVYIVAYAIAILIGFGLFSSDGGLVFGL